MSKSAIKLKNPAINKPNLDKDVEAYRALRSKIAFYEEQMKAVREKIQDAVEKVPEGLIHTEDYKISLVESTRQNFDFKSAEAELGKDALKPFVTFSTYKSLRIS